MTLALLIIVSSQQPLVWEEDWGFLDDGTFSGQCYGSFFGKWWLYSLKYHTQSLGQTTQYAADDVDIVKSKFLVNQIRGYYLNWTLILTPIGFAVFLVAEMISKQQRSDVGAMRGRLSLDTRSETN